MRKYNIAVGKSRYCRVWQNEAVTWEWLRERLSSPVVTAETMEDYRAMGRDRQTDVKDVGGFVGGYLDGGRRTAGSVRGRSLMTLDYDDFDAARLERAREALKGKLWAVHSTHKHTERAWRVRIVVAADRDMSADEYGAASRKLAEKIGLEGIDRSTFEACRLMFWPSRSTDAPYLFDGGSGEPFSVDGLLGEYEDWRDMSAWPMVAAEALAVWGERAGASGRPRDEGAVPGHLRDEGAVPGHLRDEGGVPGHFAAGAFATAGRHGRQEDPREKRGLIGAFCRSYGIHDAISAFLPELYSRCGANRYTHTGSSTSGGAWVLDDDRFLYSFHGTDPVQGRLLNSWDLVRLHRFGELDFGKEDKADRLPSFKKMEELAMGDSRVKGRMMEERARAFDSVEVASLKDGLRPKEASPKDGLRPKEASLKDGLRPKEASLKDGLRPKEASLKDGLRPKEASPKDGADASARPRDEGGVPGHLREGGSENSENSENSESSDEIWERAKEGLHIRRDGTVESTITAAQIVIDYHPSLRGKLRANLFSGDIDVEGELPWVRHTAEWVNADDSGLRGWLDRNFGINGEKKINDALTNVTMKHAHHPVRSYLEGLKWDGVPRLERLIIDCIGAEDTELNRELTKLIFTAACRRVFDPGCKYDYMVILQGPEGCGKSSVFSLMAGKDWFSDSVVSIDGKDGMDSLAGVWIAEMGELVGMKRAEMTTVKNYISRQCDKWRPAYKPKTEPHPRQCILVGTTNDEYFIRGINDKNRRFPVIEVRPEMRKIAEGVWGYIPQWRDQLWAEAMAYHREGYQIWLPPRFDAAIKAVQDAHNLDVSNPIFAEVDRFLDAWLPVDWELKGIEERRNWWRTQTAPDEEPTVFGGFRRDTATIAEVMREMMGKEPTDRDYRGLSREIGQYMQRLSGEWEKIGVRRTKLYGNQMSWRRVHQSPFGNDGDRVLESM